MNVFPQPSRTHTNGRSPVCMRMCRSRSLRLVNRFRHSSHACGCFLVSETGASAGRSGLLVWNMYVEGRDGAEKSDACALWNAVTDESPPMGVGTVGTDGCRFCCWSGCRAVADICCSEPKIGEFAQGDDCITCSTTSSASRASCSVLRGTCGCSKCTRWLRISEMSLKSLRIPDGGGGSCSSEPRRRRLRDPALSSSWLSL